MGAGYWLNPKTSQSWTVDRHELFILNQQNANTVGVPQPVYDHLLTLDPSSGMDEIRLAGINVGLVRIRDHGNYVSAQFAAVEGQVRSILRAIQEFGARTFQWPETELVIDNFTNRSSIKITIRELGQRLENGESVMGASV